jgi:hypothetical protein
MEQYFKFPTIISRTITFNRNEYLTRAVHKLIEVAPKRLHDTANSNDDVVGMGTMLQGNEVTGFLN